MNLTQLKHLFPELPDKFASCLPQPVQAAESLFKTCWYGSAGADVRLMDYFNCDHSLVGEPMRVFFFTDIDYLIDGERIGWNGNHDILRVPLSQRYGCSLALKGGCVAPVMISLAPDQQALCVHIRADDALFEATMIALEVKMDVVSYFNGMFAGPGPVDLCGLRADFSFGEPRDSRPSWREGMLWVRHPFGFSAAEGFVLIPLSQRGMDADGREAEFCRVVRLPAFNPLDLAAEYHNQLKACSPTEVSLENAEKRRREIIEGLGNVNPTGFEALL